MNKYDNNIFLRIKKIAVFILILVQKYQQWGNAFQLNVNL